MKIWLPIVVNLVLFLVALAGIFAGRKNKLLEIIKTADKKRLSQLSMPRDYRGLSKAQVSRLKSLSNKGYSNSEIAEYLGISETTVINYLTGKETA